MQPNPPMTPPIQEVIAKSTVQTCDVNIIFDWFYLTYWNDLIFCSLFFTSFYWFVLTHELKALFMTAVKQLEWDVCLEAAVFAAEAA